MRIRLDEQLFYGYLDDIISTTDNDHDTNEMYRKVIETFLYYGRIETDEEDHRIELYFRSGTILPIREEGNHLATNFYGLDLDISIDNVRMSIL